MTYNASWIVSDTLTPTQCVLCHVLILLALRRENMPHVK